MTHPRVEHITYTQYIRAPLGLLFTFLFLLGIIVKPANKLAGHTTTTILEMELVSDVFDIKNMHMYSQASNSHCIFFALFPSFTQLSTVHLSGLYCTLQ